MSTLLVTATGTGVGKTTVAAAIATLAVRRGERVAVVKPAQTGVPDGEPGDLAEILRRAPSVVAVELARYPDPLSPAAAAARSRRWPVTLEACRRLIRDLEPAVDLVLVEGAGGLLVPYDGNGFTMGDLAVELSLPVVLVVHPRLGTLNETALTLEALVKRELCLHSLVIGYWPSSPGLAEQSNIADLEHLAETSLSGVLPAGLRVVDDETFYEAALSGLDERFGGQFDAVAFRQAYPRD